MTTPLGRLNDAAPPPPPPVRRRRPSRPILRYLAATLCTLVLAAFALPDLLFGLDRYSPFAQIVSFRPWILVGVLALLAPLLVILRSTRWVAPFVAGMLAVLLVGTAAVAPRTIADPLPTSGTPLTVLEFNTLEGSADTGSLADLIRTERPDVVSLLEAGTDYRSRLAPLVEPLGYRLYTAAGRGRSNIAGVTAMVAAGLGDVRVRVGEETAAFPSVEVTGGGLGALRFVAFHAVAPLPGSVPQWESDLALLEQWCAGRTPAVVAGDLNATLDHSPLRSGMAGCADAAAQRGAGLVPTWGPTPRTRAIGPQIDHVLVTDPITAETFAAYDIAGSDHRAVLTRLRLPS